MVYATFASIPGSTDCHLVGYKLGVPLRFIGGFSLDDDIPETAAEVVIIEEDPEEEEPEDTDDGGPNNPFGG